MTNTKPLISKNNLLWTVGIKSIFLILCKKAWRIRLSRKPCNAILHFQFPQRPNFRIFYYLLPYQKNIFYNFCIICRYLGEINIHTLISRKLMVTVVMLLLEWILIWFIEGIPVCRKIRRPEWFCSFGRFNDTSV